MLKHRKIYLTQAIHHVMKHFTVMESEGYSSLKQTGRVHVCVCFTFLL